MLPSSCRGATSSHKWIHGSTSFARGITRNHYGDLVGGWATQQKWQHAGLPGILPCSPASPVEQKNRPREALAFLALLGTGLFRTSFFLGRFRLALGLLSFWARLLRFRRLARGL